MGMPYTLTNQLVDTPIATAVLVRNRLDATPTQPCEPEAAPAGAAPSFVYYPWQYLNPSPMATESFFFDGRLFVTVSQVAAADDAAGATAYRPPGCATSVRVVMRHTESAPPAIVYLFSPPQAISPA